MRKGYLIIAAVATSFLASCSNEIVLNERQDSNEQTVIGFSSFSEKATKGNPDSETNLEFYHNTFAVYGTKQSTNDTNVIQYVFGDEPTATALYTNGETCTYQETADALLGDWKYNDPRYWDKQATYDFIAYAPVSVNNPIRYHYNAAGAQVADNGNQFKTTATYVLTGTNLQATATEAEKVKGFNVQSDGDLDLMISVSNPQNGNAHDAYVNMVFRHILSKLNVTFVKASTLDNAIVTINTVTISGLDDSGDYTESNYDASTTPKVSGWTSSLSTSSTYALKYNTTDGQILNSGSYQDADNDPTTDDVYVAAKPHFFIESLVMPQEIEDDQVTLTANYTIKTGSHVENYNYKLDLYEIADLQKFFDGNNYTLNFTIQPDVIKFNATVTTWDNQPAIGKTID